MQLVLEKRAERSNMIALVSPLIAIALTIVTMSILFVILKKNPISALGVYFIDPLTDSYSLQEIAVKATPLVMIAIGLSLCYLANAWNIGAEGQFLIGAVAGSWIAVKTQGTDAGHWVLPAMLGADTPQRYFIGMQNEAEMRGTGGLPGAFAIAVASHGQVRFTHFGSDAELEPAAADGKIATGLDFGAGYTAAYGQSLPTASFLNSNVSPSFQYAGQIWARMWEQVSGEHVDGAIAVDPTVLGYVLGVTGPVQTADGITVSAQNIVSLTERDEYAVFSDNAARKAFLVSVLKASAHQLTSGRGSAAGLAEQLVLASKEQRLQVWSADPAVERELAATSYGAVLGPTSRPLAAPVLNNLSGGKLDYYLTRTLTYHRSGCGDTRDVLVTLTLTNNAPASGLPAYVTDRLDVPPGTSRPGDYSTLLDYYATKGAQLLSVRRNGTPTTATVLTVDGQPVFRLQVPLPRGATQTIELHLQEPAGSGNPVIWRQPGVTPMSVTAYSQSCG